ncbi:unnamed protein product [Pleuronectes platessa]|uniref:LRRNT domain-containing protein n=1 Tax=Pleuronectes platessa TaxID=8262 RepID=A0A9N7UXT3_PLEPL|nr:unnamed protein product [Pleuronectes platessa]
MAVAPRALAPLLPLVLALLSLAPAPASAGCPSACRCSFAMVQCLESDGITSVPTLAKQESENVTEMERGERGGGGGQRMGWTRQIRSARSLVGPMAASIQNLRYVENQAGLVNLTDFDLVHYKELKNLTVTSCRLRFISANAFQKNVKLQYV